MGQACVPAVVPTKTHLAVSAHAGGQHRLLNGLPCHLPGGGSLGPWSPTACRAGSLFHLQMQRGQNKYNDCQM